MKFVKSLIWRRHKHLLLALFCSNSQICFSPLFSFCISSLLLLLLLLKKESVEPISLGTWFTLGWIYRHLIRFSVFHFHSLHIIEFSNEIQINLNHFIYTWCQLLYCLVLNIGNLVYIIIRENLSFIVEVSTLQPLLTSTINSRFNVPLKQYPPSKGMLWYYNDYYITLSTIENYLKYNALYYVPSFFFILNETIYIDSECSEIYLKTKRTVGLLVEESSLRVQLEKTALFYRSLFLLMPPYFNLHPSINNTNHPLS